MSKEASKNKSASERPHRAVVKEGMVLLELTEEEWSQLLVMMGYAAGSAHRDGDHVMRDHFLRLSNAVNRNNPRWTPYVLDEERKPS
jgi:hypothetical protein